MFFLVGIKGSGMSALAQILDDLGFSVSGFDHEEHYQTEIALLEKRIAIYSDIKLNSDYTYIIGNAFKKHEKVVKLMDEGYNTIAYNDFIDSFFQDKVKIAVSGTHGKTTTTKLIATLLENTSYLIGDGNGRGRDDSPYFVFEACEYQNTFLKYHPEYLIITNIDLDHIDFYKSIGDVIHSFELLSKNSKYVIINQTCPNSQKLNIQNKITFGKNKDTCDYSYEIVDDKDGFDICIKTRDSRFFYYHLPFYGEYMIENFLCSFIILDLLKRDLSKIQGKIHTFKMPNRRMNEVLIENNIYICDYGHHPKEIEVTIKSIKKKYPGKILYTIFEPHTYTRFSFFLKEIQKALDLSDFYYITKVFSSEREKQTDQNYLKEFVNFDEKILKEILKLNKIVILFIGAGNIDQLFMKTVENLKKAS